MALISGLHVGRTAFQLGTLSETSLISNIAKNSNDATIVLLGAS
jgi:hypothetical protein